MGSSSGSSPPEEGKAHAHQTEDDSQSPEPCRHDWILLLLQLVQTLSEFDVSSPGVRQEGETGSEIRPIDVRPVELDAISLEFLAEGLQVVDFETDVVKGSPLRGCGRCFCPGESEIRAGKIRRWSSI